MSQQILTLIILFMYRNYYISFMNQIYFTQSMSILSKCLSWFNTKNHNVDHWKAISLLSKMIASINPPLHLHLTYFCLGALKCLKIMSSYLDSCQGGKLKPCKKLFSKKNFCSGKFLNDYILHNLEISKNLSDSVKILLRASENIY